ncbi:aromatic motif membrane protein [Mycoplasmopsis arginini]|uniref:aromatic motif membrane protein n=1 Tax=Mycoplasmopsis arginini TaxID=2094 RepID=UPI000764C90F|nr:aromatic motif membrane protein [Mycoplasmopsis arginini]
MKKIRKLILSSSLIMTLPIGMSLVSCINNEGNENLKNKIPKDLDYVPNIENPLEQKTNKLIENLININFKQDNVEKVNFLNSQKDEETLLNKAKELSNNYLNNKNEENLKLLNDFYSNNWLFVIKNIKKFNWTFLKWWTFPDLGQVKHSAEFFRQLDKQDEPDDLIFFDNNWDQLKEGDESPESPNYVFYFKKDKMLLRILIPKNKDKEGKRTLKFDRIIYFAKSRTNKVSIKLISDVVHNAIIHHNQQGYDSFEKEVIDNFGFASLGTLIIKGK